jgi:hypothetical protein
MLDRRLDRGLLRNRRGGNNNHRGGRMNAATRERV